MEYVPFLVRTLILYICNFSLKKEKPLVENMTKVYKEDNLQFRFQIFAYQKKLVFEKDHLVKQLQLQKKLTRFEGIQMKFFCRKVLSKM